jgi:hypothetical protein
MVSSRKRTEVEKFKTRLNEVIQDTKVKERGKLQDLGRAIDNMSDDEG